MDTTGVIPIKYVAAWSGGKDSTYMVDELLRRGEPLDEIIFCDTGYEHDIMYDYIIKVEKYWKDKYPKLKITKLNWGKGKEIWKKWAEGIATKGKHEGKPRGFPIHIGMAWCTLYLKVNPMKKYLKKEYKHTVVKEYVGIAANEPSRVKNTGELYPLVDWNITEDEILHILIERGLHNPLYNTFHRTGCFLCPKQSLKTLYKLYKEFPEKWKELEDMYHHYNKIEAGFNTFKGYTLQELLDKFKQYELKGMPTNYLEEEQEIGCMCK